VELGFCSFWSSATCANRSALQVLVRHGFKPPAMTLEKAAACRGGPMNWLKSVASTQCGGWTGQSGAKTWLVSGPKAGAVALA
jgi:hypothetical protein